MLVEEENVLQLIPEEAVRLEQPIFPELEMFPLVNVPQVTPWVNATFVALNGPEVVKSIFVNRLVTRPLICVWILSVRPYN